MHQMDHKQMEQEGQYAIPYHYIPSINATGYSQNTSWDWGIRYLGGLERVLSELEKIKFDSLIDIGCGDGRFLREAAARFPGRWMLGVDYSRHAVALAGAMNLHLNFQCVNIITDRIEEKFDAATMIEVLEHIPPESVGAFLKATAQALHKNGWLILTVPHVNCHVQEKHYQHFSVATLRSVMKPYFKVDRIIPFDRRSVVTYILTKLLGYKGNNYVITNRHLNALMYRHALRGCLEDQKEDSCSRLLAVARPL